MSSLRDDWSITDFIETSLEILRQEFPSAYFQLCSQLVSRTLQMFVDDESVILAFGLAEVHILPQLTHPTIELITTRQTFLDVIDAHLTLNEAILIDAIQLRGYIEDLAALYDALLIYVSGAVRSPSFPALLDNFRYVSSRLLSSNDKTDAR